MNKYTDVADAALPRRIWLNSSPWRPMLSEKERRRLQKLEDEDYASKCGPVTTRYIEPRKKLKKEEAEE